MRRSTYLTPAALCALVCLWTGPSRARVDVSVQVTVAAGACVGGVAWALAGSWSNDFVQALASSLRPAALPEHPERLDRQEADDARPVFFLPLLVMPLP